MNFEGLSLSVALQGPRSNRPSIVHPLTFLTPDSRELSFSASQTWPYREVECYRESASPLQFHCLPWGRRPPLFVMLEKQRKRERDGGKKRGENRGRERDSFGNGSRLRANARERQTGSCVCVLAVCISPRAFRISPAFVLVRPLERGGKPTELRAREGTSAIIQQGEGQNCVLEKNVCSVGLEPHTHKYV